MTNYMYISNELKKYFNRIGKTQNDIADIMGVSQQTVSAYLNGRPFGKRAAQRWSDQFGLQYNWLLTGAGAMLKDQMDSAIEEKKSPPVADNDIMIRLLNAMEQKDETIRRKDEVIREKEAEIKELRDQMEKYRTTLEQLRLAIVRGDDEIIKKEIAV